MADKLSKGVFPHQELDNRDFGVHSVYQRLFCHALSGIRLTSV